MIDTCTQIEQYKAALTAATNNNGLSIGMTLYIIKDLMLYIQDIYDKSLQKEQTDTLDHRVDVTTDENCNVISRKEMEENE